MWRAAYTPAPVAKTASPSPPSAARDPLAPFSPSVRAWFERTFEAPTRAQAEGWVAISAGRHTLIHAPTGSGKTLAAFLWCLDRLVVEPSPAATREKPGAVRTLYISPLKALTYDIERNLRAPLAGIAVTAERLGLPAPHVSIASRTGDTPAADRRDLVRHPPDILVTTPESLYLMLTSGAREILAERRARHRGRGPRDGGLETRRAPRAEPRATRGAATGRGAAAPADRVVRHAATARDDRPLPGRRGAGPRGRDRRCRHAQGRSSSRSSCRWTT